ncbi:MAG: HisA/HisF-related TIM barrel protein [Actinomycetes bacterium]
MSNAQFTLMAGVEIANGQVEVLSHGEADDTHQYGDPRAATQKWVNAGAHWIHIADLDAAAGRGNNSTEVAQAIDACRGAAHVQLAGGIRDDASLAAALQTTARRVVTDAAALADLDWVAGVATDSDDRVSVGITAHHEEIFAPGSDAHGLDLVTVLETLKSAHCRNFVVTDVDSKGVRKKSQRHVLTTVLKHSFGHVVCCGGISYLQDLHALTELVPQGLSGVVVDRALYTEAFTFPEAMAALEARYDLFYWGPPS